MTDYFSVKFYRQRVDGSTDFAAAYIVQTSPELVRGDLKRGANGVLKGPADLEAEERPDFERQVDEDIIVVEWWLARLVATMHFFNRFGRPSGDWSYDIKVCLLTSLDKAPDCDPSVVNGIHCWLQEEGPTSSQA